MLVDRAESSSFTLNCVLMAYPILLDQQGNLNRMCSCCAPETKNVRLIEPGLMQKSNFLRVAKDPGVSVPTLYRWLPESKPYQPLREHLSRYLRFHSLLNLPDCALVRMRTLLSSLCIICSHNVYYVK